MRIILNPAATRLTRREATVWGLVHYLATAGWQQYGVLPPPALGSAPQPHLINVKSIAEILSVPQPEVQIVWDSLIQKGAMKVE